MIKFPCDTVLLLQSFHFLFFFLFLLALYVSHILLKKHQLCYTYGSKDFQRSTVERGNSDSFRINILSADSLTTSPENATVENKQKSENVAI